MLFNQLQKEHIRVVNFVEIPSENLQCFMGAMPWESGWFLLIVDESVEL